MVNAANDKSAVAGSVHWSTPLPARLCADGLLAKGALLLGLTWPIQGRRGGRGL